LVEEKIAYNKLPRALKLPYAVAVWTPIEARYLWHYYKNKNVPGYFALWSEYKKSRGMSRWHDMVDWIGGYPYECVTAEALAVAGLRPSSRRRWSPICRTTCSIVRKWGSAVPSIIGCAQNSRKWRMTYCCRRSLKAVASWIGALFRFCSTNIVPDQTRTIRGFGRS